MIELLTEPVQERLYRLLPSIYRQRDKLQGEMLRVFMDALESEFQALEADIEGLYDDWFIETCAEWVIPYIAELLGADEFGARPQSAISERRLVANTIGYRRRKGVAATLEQVVGDVTGWQARVVEYVNLLACTQHLAHIRAGQGGLVDLRQVPAEMGGPFDELAHTIDVRQGGASMQGVGDDLPTNALPSRYYPESLGLFLWRLPAYQVRAAIASPAIRDAVTGRFIPQGGFTFDPLRRDIQLYSAPRETEENGQDRRTGPDSVPAPISRAAFAEDLRRYAALARNGRIAASRYYGPGASLYMLLNGKAIAPEAVLGADLSQWRHPAEAVAKGKQVAVDVGLGRILFLDGQGVTRTDVVEVTYSYGFSGDVGAGPYRRTLRLPLWSADHSSPGRPRFGSPRPSTMPADNAPVEEYTINVYKGSRTDTLKKALGAWEHYCKSRRKPRGTIRILDSKTYTEGELSIVLPESGALTIEAAQGMRPAILLGEPGHPHPQGHPQGSAPTYKCKCLARNTNAASLTLNGLLIDGKLEVEGNLKLNVSHCTLPQGIGLPEPHSVATTLQISIDHSIVGPLHLPHGRGELTIQDSIVDHKAGYAIHLLPLPADNTQATKGREGINASLERVTVFGQVRVHGLTLAKECIFTAPVLVEEQDTGLVRFSYVPAGSRTPRREHCLPHCGDAQEPVDIGEMPDACQDVYPLFTSSHYGDAGYAQLAASSAEAIMRGAEDGGQMGVFHDLGLEQRRDSLATVLDEYVPFGFAVDVCYMT